MLEKFGVIVVFHLIPMLRTFYFSFSFCTNLILFSSHIGTLVQSEIFQKFLDGYCCSWRIDINDFGDSH